MKKNKITELEPQDIAEIAGLVYVNDSKPGIQRKRLGKSFRYIGTDGKTIKDRQEIKRIQALAIPPAYEDVWICPKPNGHIQATGRDARGRKQYKYHPRWRKVSDETKYAKMVAFAHALPDIRKKVQQDLALSGMPKEKVLAAIVLLLEVTLIRVGNEEYVKENNSFGLTTLQNRHANISGKQIEFKFRGKSGKTHEVTLSDKRLAKIVKRCQDLPGQDLFEFIDENDSAVAISSTDVNEYLKAIAQDNFTAKDFRTWAGTVLAFFALQEFLTFETETEAKRNIVQAIEKVSQVLGNTPAICRKSYIHPLILTSYLEGKLLKVVKEKQIEVDALQKIVDKGTQLSSEESSVLSFLKKQLKI